MCPVPFFFFFFNDTATTEIYTLSLHDALPIYPCGGGYRAGFLATPETDDDSFLSKVMNDCKHLKEPRKESSSVSRSEEHTSELQSQSNLVCRLLLEKKKKNELERRHHTQCSAH